MQNKSVLIGFFICAIVITVAFIALFDSATIDINRLDPIYMSTNTGIYTLSFDKDNWELNDALFKKGLYQVIADVGQNLIAFCDRRTSEIYVQNVISKEIVKLDCEFQEVLSLKFLPEDKNLVIITPFSLYVYEMRSKQVSDTIDIPNISGITFDRAKNILYLSASNGIIAYSCELYEIIEEYETGKSSDLYFIDSYKLGFVEKSKEELCFKTFDINLQKVELIRIIPHKNIFAYSWSPNSEIIVVVKFERAGIFPSYVCEVIDIKNSQVSKFKIKKGSILPSWNSKIIWGQAQSPGGISCSASILE